LTEFIFTLGARQLEPPSWAILEPISRGFGHVINFLFILVHSIGPANSLGIAIVLMTIIFRFLIMPLGLKSQKSMMKMRELKPELDKLKAKYGDTKDPEKMKKFQQEQSALLAKHGAHPLSGCLPLLIQMPLFIGLNTVMRQAAVYIPRLREMYEYLAMQLLNIPGLIGYYDEATGAIQTLAEGRAYGFERIIPEAWVSNLHTFEEFLVARGTFYGTTVEQIRNELAEFGEHVIILGFPDHLAQVISRFTPADWDFVYEHIADPDALANIQPLVNELMGIERFLGISIVESSGWALPGIIIPIITGISMFISSWFMQLRTFDPNADERAVLTQKMMLFVMPFIMAFFTVNLVAAVGVFWITGQIFQTIQDIVLIKKSGTPIRLPFSKPVPEVVDVVPVKKKKERKT